MTLSLERSPTSQRVISLVPMIDVLLILLVFFMVTSTYLDLDMIPMVEESGSQTTEPTTGPKTLLVRIGADGQAYLRGQAVNLEQLSSELRRTDGPISVVLLPSSRATTQDLVSAMGTLTAAGVETLRLMRLEADP